MIDRLVIEQLPMALRFAQRLTGDANTAEDLVQEMLARVLRQWRTLEKIDSLRPWMMQILVNVYRDNRRKKQSQQTQFDEGAEAQLATDSAEPASQVAALELDEQIRSAVENLPDRQREVALLRFGEDMKVSEIAEVLSISKANVHASLHLARERIAKRLGIAYAKK